MKLFVTGGTGFVGSHFINAAHKKNYEVTALKRPKSIPRFPLTKEPEWIVGELDGDFSNELQGCDILVHFAAHSPNPPYDTLEKCLYWNLTASIRLFNQAYEAGIRKFLVAGSCFEYGKSGERYEFIPVTAPLEPTMSYPTSKAAASTAFYGWGVEKNVKLQILRIFQVYGEGEQASRLWPSLRKAALAGEDFPMTEGEQVRDFINVKDVANLFVEAARFESIEAGIPEIKNVGSGKPQTVRQFSEFWWNHWNASGVLTIGAKPYRTNEVMRFVPEL
jgi:nucleoside-diphosphate-sugar epimerase